MNIEVNKEAIQVPPPTTTENFYPPRLPQRSPGGIRFVIVSRGHGGRRRLNYGGVNDFPPLREGEVGSRRPWEDRRGAGLGGSRRRSSGLWCPRARTPAMDGTGALA